MAQCGADRDIGCISILQGAAFSCREHDAEEDFTVLASACCRRLPVDTLQYADLAPYISMSLYIYVIHLLWHVASFCVVNQECTFHFITVAIQ